MSVAVQRDQRRALVHARRDRVTYVEVPRRRYLAVDGCERPGGQTFRNAIGTLYPIAYSLHFLLKRAGIDVPVGAIEGLFWPAGGQGSADVTERESPSPQAWNWRLMVPVPDAATEEDVERAIRVAAEERSLPAISCLHVVEWQEGESAQMLHVGPYAAEPQTIARLQKAIARAGLRVNGPHHEIWLNDPHRVGEARAKTIIRFAVRPLADGEQKGSN
jgi:hypothetical protein